MPVMTKFQLQPMEIPENFSWRRDRYHLTWQYKIPVEDIFDAIAHATTIRLTAWSICHETSKDGYEHTHGAFIFEKRLDLTGARLLDVYVTLADESIVIVHPNILPRVSMVQMEHIFTRYHAGFKYDPSVGKVTFTQPELHEVQMPPEFEFNREIIREIITSTSLNEACVVSGVRPRTVSDLRALRDEASRQPKRFKHKYDPLTFRQDIFPENFAVVHAWGPTNVGKTKAALAQFENPLLIKPFKSRGALEQLQHFSPGFHDGIVCDEADLRFMSREEVISFLDMDETFNVDIRYKTFDLEPCRKIIISNRSPDGLYPADTEADGTPIGAIDRRKVDIYIGTKTYITPGGPQPQLVSNTLTPNGAFNGPLEPRPPLTPLTQPMLNTPPLVHAMAYY